jgi:hypothetical protein
MDIPTEAYEADFDPIEAGRSDLYDWWILRCAKVNLEEAINHLEHDRVSEARYEATIAREALAEFRRRTNNTRKEVVMRY